MGKTIIYTFSVVRSSSEQFKDKTPYVTAILEDESGVRFPAFVEGYIDGMDVYIGQPINCQVIEGKQSFFF